MKYWSLTPGKGWQTLELKKIDRPQPSVGELRIQIIATSINARDLMVATGHYPAPTADRVIPLSDAAGVVTAIGEGVKDFALGDRVVIPFNNLEVPIGQKVAFEDVIEAFAALEQGKVFGKIIINQFP